MKRFIVFFGCFLLFGAVTAFAQLDLQPVAVVRLARTEQITVRQLREYVQWLTMNMAMTTGNPNITLNEAQRRQALEELGNQFLANQAAEQARITVNERDLNLHFEQSMRNFSAGLAQVLGRAPTDAEVDAELLQRTGMNRASFREMMRRTLVVETYLQTRQGHLFQALTPPTEAEILAIYNQHRDRSIFENGFIRPDAARVRMVVVPMRTPAERTAALAHANTLAAQIGGSAATFDEVARDFMRPNSGYITAEGLVYNHDVMRTAMGTNFVNAVFNLRLGEVSQVVERADGFYILRIMETFQGRTLGLDDVLDLQDTGRVDQMGRRHPPVTVRQAIATAEMQRRFNTTLQQASQELVEDLRRRGSVQTMENTFNSIVW